MAALQKIRSKGPLLVIIIGLALFAFIAEEAMRSIQSATNESKMRIGEIYGESISAHEFQEMVDEQANAMKFIYGSALNDEQMTQVRDQVWNQYVTNQLINREAEKLGLTVTDAEIQSILAKGNHPLLMRTPFRNQQTGKFDLESLKKFLTEYEGYQKSNELPVEYMTQLNELHKYWMYIEKTLRQEALNQKYQMLLSNSLLNNKVIAKANFDARTNESDIVMAALPYSSINDNDVKVEDKELSAKYEELKERFKQMDESRNIKFIDVEVKASAADKAELDKEMAEAAKALAEGENIAKVVRESGSVINYNKMPVSKNAFPRDIAQQLDSMSAGQMKAPYLNAGDNTMNIIKVISKTTAPDSIEFRTIQVAGADLEAAKKTADSIVTALNNGAVFDSIAKKYNQTGAKNWITSRDYEGATLDEENLKYITTITNAPINKVEKIELAQGCIIAQVTDRRAMIDKYDVAVIKRPIEFSNETYAKAYNDFSHFLASNPTQAEIEAKALKSGYNLQERKDLYSNEHYVGNVRNTRDALRWIFNEDREAGDVSPLYECGENNHMMVVVLTGINKKGYRSLESVKDYLTQEVLKDKKAEMLKEKMANAKAIADVTKLQGAVSDTVKHVTFSAPAFIGRTGASEPMVSAVASKTEKGKFANAIKGNAGVYALQVINKGKSSQTFDPQTESIQMDMSNRRALSNFIQELYEKAKVTDNRYLFF